MNSVIQEIATMEREQYTVPISKILGDLITKQIPENAVIHYWYEIEQPTKKKIIKNQSSKSKKSWKETAAFGMWRDRPEMEDVYAYVRGN